MRTATSLVLLLVLSIKRSTGECGKLSGGIVGIDGCSEESLTRFEHFLTLSTAEKNELYETIESEYIQHRQQPNVIEFEFQKEEDAIHSKIEEAKRAGMKGKQELRVLEERASSARADAQARLEAAETKRDDRLGLQNLMKLSFLGKLPAKYKDEV